MKKNPIILVVGLLLIGAIVFLGGSKWRNQSAKGQVLFDKDQTFAEDYTMPLDKDVVVKNGAKLVFEKNLTISGLVSCENGPLNLVVKGKLKIDRYVKCGIGENLKEGEAGNGIMIVAKSIEVNKDAIIASNGSVQVVTEEGKLATTADAVNKIYDEAGKLNKEKKFFGPFIPFDEIPQGVQGAPTTENISNPVASSEVSSQVSESGFLAFIPVARAANMERAVDNEGNEVRNTIRIGGTWVVGSNPPGLLPEELKIPTPPAGIKKIILNFDMGGEDVSIGSFTLYGPDGRLGTAGELNCDSKGGKGENAMRLNVNASNITLGNFEIHLGAGGAGGDAGTSTDCEHGKSTGGDGGESGNIRMIAEEGIAIEGTMNIFPGAGGRGGDAYAYGKKGDDGCDGKKGGDATAKGGVGGDNKKGLMVSGAVTGRENVTIHDIFGGSGGLAVAKAGNGGNGTGPKCAGGEGGKATATGGKGGSAQSVRATSVGGNGGFSTANAGNGGNGGNGSATEAGGNGGKGGDASSVPGDGGQGTTRNGGPGSKVAEQGGNGGNGGDGCGPGDGGAAGSGTLNPGVPGSKGKNLCVDLKDENVLQDLPTPTPTPKTSTEATFNISGPLSFSHTIGTTSCPQNIGTVSVTGSNIPDGTTIKIDGLLPGWLEYKAEAERLRSIMLRFTCQLQKYETQSLSSDVKVKVIDAQGKTLKDFSVKVTGSVKK